MNYREHTRWGKWIGAILGFIMAGPLGAFFGIFIGNFFDRGLALHLSKPQASYRTESRSNVRNLFIEATFSIMGQIAKADGRVSEQSILMTKTLMREMGLNQAQRTHAQHFFNAGKQPTFRASTILAQLQTAAHDNPTLIRSFVDIQYRLAQVDGLSLKKITLLNILFNQLGLAPVHNQSRFYDDFTARTTNQQQSQYQSQYQRSSYSANQAPPRATYPGMINEAYALLTVNPNASKDEVKRAYRRLISRNHPDKMMAQGATEQTIKAANEKTQTIRKAYEHICASRGW